MKKLSRAEDARITELEKKLELARLKVSSVSSDLESLVDQVNTAIDEYNEVLQEARGFAEDIATIQNDYYDERSEKWQEGDNGQAYSDWKGEWENWQPDDIEHIEVPTLDIEDHGDQLAELPREPNY